MDSEPPTKKRRVTRETWSVPCSDMAKKTNNPIRKIIDEMKLEPNPEKDMIPLSIGDPTVFGNLPLADEICDAVCKAARSQKANGYCASFGMEKTREAIAEYASSPNDKITAQDVVLASGCSGALDMCISVLANPGQVILAPRPGFSLYKTLAESLGITVLNYDLLPERQWEVDLDHLESLIDERAAAIVVNNPSNPCGSVYSRRHLLDIVNVASRHKLPIIGDEIYADFVFPGEKYHSLGSISEDVPILSCGGLTKRYLVPGWRLGWVAIHDRNGVFKKEVSHGLIALSQRILGPNTIIQAAVPEILHNTPREFFDRSINTVKTNAQICYAACSKIPGLNPIMPQGAMYMMVGFDVGLYPFSCDLELAEKMVEEQSVFVLPGKCFQFPHYFRVVLTIPEDKMRVAVGRMEEFFRQHCDAAAMERHIHAEGKHAAAAGKHVGVKAADQNGVVEAEAAAAQDGF